MGFPKAGLPPRSRSLKAKFRRLWKGGLWSWASPHHDADEAFTEVSLTTLSLYSPSTAPQTLNLYRAGAVEALGLGSEEEGRAWRGWGQVGVEHHPSHLHLPVGGQDRLGRRRGGQSRAAGHAHGALW